MDTAENSTKERDINIVLVGKTGNGKSATGNTLLGRKEFESKRAANPVTDICAMHKCTAPTKTYNIVDSPGLFDTTCLAKRAMEIQRSVEVCPNKETHAFLLVMNASTRVTPEDIQTVEFLKMIFGENVSDQMIVVFTHGDDFESEKEFTQFWKTTKEYVTLIEDCGGRVCRINNKATLRPDDSWKHPIYGLVDCVSENGKNTYKYEYLKQHHDAFQHHINTYKGGMAVVDQLQSMLSDISNRIEAEIKRREEEIRKQREKIKQEEEEMKKREEEEKRKAMELEEQIKRRQEEMDKRQKEIENIKDEATRREREVEKREMEVRMKEMEMNMKQKFMEQAEKNRAQMEEFTKSQLELKQKESERRRMELDLQESRRREKESNNKSESSGGGCSIQ